MPDADHCVWRSSIPQGQGVVIHPGHPVSHRQGIVLSWEAHMDEIRRARRWWRTVWGNWITCYIVFKTQARVRELSAVHSLRSQQGLGKTERVNEAVVAAMAIGTGLGVHFSDPFDSVVASAGVVATALITRRQYRSAFAQLETDIQTAHDRISELVSQIEAVHEAAQARLSTMTAISHEIRSPLSAVIALGDLLHSMPLTSEQSELVRDIRGASEMVLSVVNDTLDLAKLEKGRLEFAQRPFSLPEVFNRVARQARALASTKPAVSVLDPVCPIDTVIGDELRLQQVLLNLMSNAVKFTNSGDVRLSAQALAAPGGDRWLLTFQIDDQGPGVTLTDQQQLFRPYTQGRDTAPSDIKGTGLGLYLSRMLVEQMGGEIGVRNRPEGGAQFWFSLTLPRAPSSAANSAAARSPATRPNELALRGRTVWVVDDGRLNREVARRVVETHGGQCRLFDSAQAFLDNAGAAEQPADVVLMDIEMPELDGVSASRALRELPQWANVPVIAVTGLDSEHVAEALRRDHLTDFVLKPFHTQTLLKAIQAQLTPTEP